jgi:hypothetical protein
MHSLRVTLLCDGSSDRVLLPIVAKLFDFYSPVAVESTLASRLPPVCKTLKQRIQAAVDLYPCDLLIIHRDAEKQEAVRRLEINNAIAGISQPYLVAMPIRMTEAWLLCQEQAIRNAVGNPNGKIKLKIPTLDKRESCDAKKVLFEAMRDASELGLQRAQKIKADQLRHRVAELLTDFTGLRQLPSFQHFEHQVKQYCTADLCSNLNF